MGLAQQEENSPVNSALLTGVVAAGPCDLVMATRLLTMPLCRWWALAPSAYTALPPCNSNTPAGHAVVQVVGVPPKYLDRTSVPGEALASERELLREQALKSGKPEAIVERIVEGRLGERWGEAGVEVEVGGGGRGGMGGISGCWIRMCGGLAGKDGGRVSGRVVSLGGALGGAHGRVVVMNGRRLGAHITEARRLPPQCLLEPLCLFPTPPVSATCLPFAGKFYGEHCLLEQAYLMNTAQLPFLSDSDHKTVGGHLKGRSGLLVKAMSPPAGGCPLYGYADAAAAAVDSGPPPSRRWIGVGWACAPCARWR